MHPIHHKLSTNTIALLLTPPPPAPTAPAPSTESRGEALVSVVIDAGIFDANSLLTTAPTTEENDEAFLSVVSGLFSQAPSEPPSPTFSLVSSRPPSLSESLTHLDFECQAAYYDRCT